METNSFEAVKDNGSSTTLLDKVQSEFPEFLSEINGFMTGDKKSPPVVLSHNKPEPSKSDRGENNFFGPENGDESVASCLKELDARSLESKKESLSPEQGPSFMNSFLVELVHGIKGTLASIYHTTLVTMDKPEDVEMRKHSRVKIKEDINKIDSVLNSLLNFININTPIAKTNTLYTILEEILEANEKQLQEKNINIIKRCEKDLPETYIHNEQLKFILHSILQYVIFSTPPHDSIGFLMKSLDFHDDTDAKGTSLENKGGYVEIVIGFNGDRKLDLLENPSDIPEDQKEATDLILRLVKEILQKNRGMMLIETNGKRPKTLITLRFPIERRNVVYYAPINI